MKYGENAWSCVRANDRADVMHLDFFGREFRKKQFLHVFHVLHTIAVADKDRVFVVHIRRQSNVFDQARQRLFLPIAMPTTVSFPSSSIFMIGLIFKIEPMIAVVDETLPPRFKWNKLSTVK